MCSVCVVHNKHPYTCVYVASSTAQSPHQYRAIMLPFPSTPPHLSPTHLNTPLPSHFQLQETKATNTGERSDIFKLIRLIMQRGYDPCIVFSFSKRECEALALQMVSLDLNTDAEKKLVQAIYTNALECLSEDDRCVGGKGGVWVGG